MHVDAEPPHALLQSRNSGTTYSVVTNSHQRCSRTLVYDVILTSIALLYLFMQPWPP